MSLDALREQIRSRLAADLTWTLQSPPLAWHPDFAVTRPLLPSDHAPVISEPLLEEVKSRFLGPYFELLWKTLIKTSSNLELTAHSLQITHQGRTLGEFDYLLRDRVKDLYIHQEVAVKFYLGVSLPQNPALAATPDSAWFGPNSVDRLDLKLHKLLEQQLHLAEQPAATTVLEKLGIRKVRREMLMKGYLFHPLGQRLTLPPYSHPDCLQGHWLPVSRTEELERPDCLWQPLSRLQWLAGPQPGEKTLSFAGLKEYLNREGHRPVLISSIPAASEANSAGSAEESEPGSIESGRYFVVPDDWQRNALMSLENSPLTGYA